MALNWAEGASAQVTAGGVALEYSCFGPAPSDAAPTLVLLHEGLGCVALWRDFPAALAEATGCAVFVYSRAGYGGSAACALPRPLDYMTREATEVLPEVLDALGARQVILLGHSDGATIAAEYAGRIEDFRVRGLILMAPHFFTEPGGLAEIARAKEAYDTGDLRARLAKYHSDVDMAFRGWNDAWLHPDFADWHVGEVIDFLRIPVLAIQGAEDAYGTLAQIDEIDSRIYSPLDTVIVPECGHAPHLEAPEATVSAVVDFVARLRRIEAEVVKVA